MNGGWEIIDPAFMFCEKREKYGIEAGSFFDFRY